MVEQLYAEQDEAYGDVVEATTAAALQRHARAGHGQQIKVHTHNLLLS